MGAGSVGGPFLVGEVVKILHANLVAIIYKIIRYARHSEEKSHCHLELRQGVAIATVGSLEIVVGRWNGNISKVFGLGEQPCVVLCELSDGALSVFGEISMLEFIPSPEGRALLEECEQ